MITIREKLFEGNYLNAYSLEPKMTQQELRKLLSDLRTTEANIDLVRLETEMPLIANLELLTDLEIQTINQEYEVPEPFQAYREALDDKLSTEGMFNGPVMVVKGAVSNPLTIIKGRYFDFKATELTAKPGELLPDLYPADKTIAELLPEYDLTNNNLARYLGFAFIMRPDNGAEVSFVQRAKNLGVAADCMAFPGSTPTYPSDFNNPDFDIHEHFAANIRDEMKEEYALESDEFQVEKSLLIDDTNSIPFLAITIATPLTTQELAKRTYGKKEVLKEQTILYSVKPVATSVLITQFPVLESSAYIMSLINDAR